MGRPKTAPMNFKSMSQVDVPQGRNGKHKGIVTKILSDLDRVAPGVALQLAPSPFKPETSCVEVHRPTPAAVCTIVQRAIVLSIGERYRLNKGRQQEG